MQTLFHFLLFFSYNELGDYMLLQVKKIQFVVGVLLLLQVFCPLWHVPFHFLAVILSLVVICWRNVFKVLQIQYHCYVIALYFYRIWLFSIASWYLLEWIYICVILYLALILLLCSFRAIL